MKVLVVWGNYFNYLDGIVNALRENGHQAWIQDIPYYGKRTNHLERLFQRWRPNAEEVLHWEKVRESILQKSEELCVDICLIINGNRNGPIYNESFFCEMRKRGTKTVLWAVDAINKMRYESFLNLYDEVYSFEQRDIEFAQKKYGIAATYLPLGADGYVYNNHNISSDKEYDICFAGGLNKEKIKVLNFVAKYCLRNNKKMIVYGGVWREMGRFRGTKNKLIYSALSRFMVETKIDPYDLANLYKKTRININIKRKDHSSLNPRAFEILATQGFQIIDYNKNYENILENKKHVVMYRDLDELEELLNYYFAHEDERDTIAKNGYELVHNKYLIKELVKEIIK